MNSLHLLAETYLFGILIHPWKIVGLTGSVVFGLRFIIQWIASERARKSVIPFGFWECSALGSILNVDGAPSDTAPDTKSQKPSTL